MQEVIIPTFAEIQEINGKAYILNKEGELIEVKIGDQLFSGATLFTEYSAKVVMSVNGKLVTVDKNCIACLDESNQEEPIAFQQIQGDLQLDPNQSPEQLEIQALQDAILAGEDPTEILEAPAAGAVSQSANQGFVTIDYSYQSTLATTDFSTSTLLFEPTQAEDRVTATNDGVPLIPKAPEIPANSFGFVQEDNITDISGKLVVDNIQANQNYVWEVIGSSTSEYGSFFLNTDTGEWEYKLNNDSPLIQSLANDQILTDTFTVSVSNGNLSSTENVVISIVGTNDAPVISGINVSTVNEGDIDESNPTVSETLSESDIDITDEHSWAVINDGNGEYGRLTIKEGVWEYTLENERPNTQALALNETVTDTFTIVVSDGNGGITQENVTITIIGTNDLPIIDGASTGLAVEDLVASATGQLESNDADEGDAVTWGVTNSNGAFGSLEINDNGQWSYTLDDSLAATQGLAEGEIQSEVFQVIADDGHGEPVIHEVTIEVAGTNDAPEITDVSVIAGDVEHNETESISGQLEVEDVDITDTHTWTVQPNNNSDLGTFSVDANGLWNFDLNSSSSQVIALGEGETLDVTYVVDVTDNNGAIDAQEVTITITGDNNAAVITRSATQLVVEDTVDTAAGQLQAIDPDNNDSLTWTVTDGAGTYGSLVIDNTTGEWTYTLDNTKTATQSLAEGEIQTETFNVIIDDGTEQVTHTITVNVAGTNDIPEILNTSVVSGAIEHTVTESATGQLVVSDVDSTDTHTWTVQPNSNDDLGTFGVDANGLWSFDLNTTSPQIIALGSGETLDITYAVEVVDNNGATDTQQVTITVTGTNDLPVISGTDVGAVAEDTINSATGQLDAIDPDTNDTNTWSVTDGAGTYGSLAIDSTGEWTYILDNTLAATQALAEGETQTETFEVVVDDGTDQVTHTITVNVAGTNDAPEITNTSVITGAIEHTVTESATGQLVVSDVDSTDTHTWTVQPNSNDDLGTFGVDANGLWSFDLNTTSPQIIALGSGETLDITYAVEVVDNNGATDTQQVTITVTGTNDLPVISGTDVGAVAEDTINSATGQLDAIDPDTNDTNTWSVTDGAGTYGSLAIDSTGEWTYTLDNTLAATQALAEGETQTETFEVVVDDGTDQVTHTITVNVAGTNDAPEITNTSVITGAIEHTVTESATGQLVVSDVDSTDTHTWTVQPNSNGDLGTFGVDANGLWSFDLNTTFPQVIALGNGETLDITYAVEVVDNNGATDTQQVTITVTGTNDLPVISGTDVGAVAEDTINSATGQLDAIDPDTNDTNTWSVTDGAGTYGSLAIDSTGEWTYTLDNTLPATQALAEGETQTETFEVVVDDGTDQVTHTITVNVAGTNDAPEITNTSVIAGAVEHTVTESATGQLVVSDVDTGDTHTWTVQPNSNGDLGTFGVDANGLWSFDLNTTSPQIIALGNGETLDITYAVEVVDNNGATDTQQVTITVTGTNDLPVISGTDVGAVAEDTINSATGQLDAIDPDTNDTNTWSVTDGAGTYGSLAIDSTGEWTYTLDNTLPATQALAAGETQTETFEIVVNDGTDQVTHTITVNVAGTNDAPEITNTSVIAGAIEHTVTESATGQLVVSDVDSTDTHTWSVQPNGNGDLGTFGVDATGLWTFDLNTTSPQVIALGNGETLDITYAVEVVDNNGAIDIQQVTITVTGTNDLPVISGTDVGAVAEDTINSATGQLDAIDPDTNDTNTWSVTDGAGTYGSLAIDSTGEWTYTLDNTLAATQALAEGETQTETFEVVVDDGTDQVTHTITVNVAGTNDAPEITNTSVIAGAIEHNVTESATGQLVVSDVDTGDTHTWTVQPNSNGDLGTFSVDANGLWTFDLNNASSQITALGEGETLDITYMVEVEDNNGATDTQEVTITVTGDNDLATISGTDTGSVVEDTVNSATGQLDAIDPDINDTSTWTVSNGAGTYGSLAIDNTSGEWTYTLDNTLATTQALAEGDTQTDTFVVAADDGNGGVVNHTITINITGTNDAPEVTNSSVIAGAVTEESQLTTSGDLFVADVDNADTHSWALISGNTDPYGSIAITNNADGSAQWNYTLNNSSTEVQTLANGETRTVEYQVEVTDSQGATDIETITIEITGTNDIPELSGQMLGTVKENAIDTAQGQLVVDDVDIADTHTWSVDSETGTYGSLTVDANGQWTYTIDNSLVAVQNLAEGETAQDTFTVIVDDGEGGTASKTVTVSVEGTNDLPSIVDSNDTGTVTEDTVFTASDTLSVTDIDLTDSHNWFVMGSSEPRLGTFTIDGATGTWTYTLDNDEAQLLAVGETVTETFVVVVGDGNSGFAQHSVEITVVGQNDAPSIVGRTTGTTVEDISTTTTGSLTADDIDYFDTHSWSVNGGGVGVYGAMSVDADGNWLYTLSDTSTELQQLAENQIVSETFTITADDGNGGTDEIDVVVEILGTNDAPVIAGTSVGTISEDDAPSVSGQLSDGDIDINDTHTWSLLSDNEGRFGSIAIDDSGEWIYTIDNSKILTQALAEGETFQETFVVQVADPHGGVDTINVVVDVVGTNDIPELSGVRIGSVEEDSAIQIAQGDLSPEDIDFFDSHTWSLNSGTGAYGTMTIDSDGKWVYTLNNSSFAVQELSEGEIVFDNFIVTVTDSQGASTSKEMIITITGDNDAPTIEGAITGSVVEDTVGKETATGDLTTLDVDHLDTHTWSIISPTGAYGDLSIDAATGQWTYQLDNDRDTTEALSSGEVAQDTFLVEVEDNNGGIGRIEVTIDIAGTNSAPNIVGDTAGFIKEDDTPNTVEGTLDSGDLDVGDTLTWEIMGSEGSYGDLALAQDGTWVYTLNNNSNTVNSLGEGETLNDVITVKVSDAFGESSTTDITITIEGTNDAPNLGGALTGTATEDTDTVISGLLTKSDPDNNDVHAWYLDSGIGQYGSMNVDNLGLWTYSLTNDDPAVQALAPGETLEETFTVTVTDSFGESSTDDIVITITGTNDLPAITGGLTGEYIEDVSSSMVTGQLITSDVDNGDSTSFEERSYIGNYGTFTINTDGSWSYDINNTSPIIQDLNEGETISETFAAVVHDTNGGFTTEQINFTIVGTNDVPVISGDSTAAVIEDAYEYLPAGETFVGQFTKVTGNVIADDVDFEDEIVSWQVVDGSGTYGVLTIDENGQWTYLLDNFDPDTNALNFGDTGTELFYVTATDKYGGVSDPFAINVTIEGNTDPTGGTGGDTPDQTITITDAIEEGVTNTGSQIGGTPVEGDIAVPTGETVTNVSGNTSLFGTITIDSDGHWVYTVNDDKEYVDSLTDGQEVNEDWYVTVTYSDGTSETILIDATITGSNDAPEIVTDSPTLGETGEVIEDKSLEVSGQLEVNDPDAGDSHTWYIADPATGTLAPDPTTFQGTYGTLTLDQSTGEWNYELDNTLQEVQDLLPNQIETDTFNVVVQDNEGVFSNDAIISIKITGVADDAETVQVLETITYIEDSGDPIVQTGTLDDVDGLTPELVWNLVSGSGSYGNLTLDSNGDWSYTLDNDADSVQRLNEGEVVTDSFNVTVVDQFGKTVVDESGAPVYLTFQVDVTGTNDAPIIGGTLNGTISNTDSNGTISGRLDEGDVDSADTHTWSVVDGNGDYGTLSINSFGRWTYNLDQNNNDVIVLGEGEQLTETFEVKTIDSHGEEATETVTVVIDGSNLAPEFNSDPSSPEFVMNLKEDTLITDSRTLVVTDPNAGDVVTFQAKTLVGTYGAFSVDAAGVWTYTVDNEEAHIQSLMEGEIVTEIFTVTAVDEHGAKTDQQVTINLEGTNDAPVLSGTSTGIVTEQDGDSVTGTFAISDVDAGDTVVFSVASQGQYGTATVDTALEQGTYVVDGTNPAVNSLAKGETLTDTLVIQVTDQNGGVSTLDITIIINGQNDAPDLAITVTDGVSEDTDLNTESQLVSTGNWESGDPDASDTHVWTVLSGDPLGELNVENNGDYTFTIDNSITEVQELGVGESRDFTYNVQVTDEHGRSSSQTITFTVNGTNDVPTVELTSVLEGTVEEDGTLTQTGQLDIADVDVSDINFTFTVTNPTSTYGTMSVDANGEWTYTLDNTQAQDIGDETITETFTIQIDDGNGGVITQDVDINIVGTDDAPYLDSPNTVVEGTVSEDDVSHVEGTISYIDPENTAISYQVDPASTSTYGSFQINPTTGLWEYDLNNTTAQTLAVDEVIQESFIINIADETGQTLQETVTITIQGDNDAPIITANVTEQATEDTDVNADNLTLTGTFQDGDVDILDTHTWSVLNGDSLGTLTFDTSGNYTLLIDNTATEIQELGVGETRDLSYEIQVTDEHGASDTETVTFTVNGTNDTPTVELTSVISGTVEEDGTLTQTGQLDIADVDVSDISFTFTVTNPTSTYGTMSVDGSGEWTYTLDNTQAQDIGDETITETFTIQIDDGNGGVITQDVDITIVGNDDDPYLDTPNTVVEGTVTEDDVLHIEGTIAYIDPENSAIDYQVDPASTSAYGTFQINATTGLWEFDLDNAVAQSLAVNEEVEETFTINITDATGNQVQETVTVTIQGANDAPIITANVTAQATEDTDVNADNLTLTGTFEDGDVDTLDTHTWTVLNSDSLGTLSFDASGNYTLVIDNTATEIQELGAGETRDLSYDIQVTDNNGVSDTQTVIFTVNGTNDTPTVELTSVTSGIVEEDGTLTQTGQLDIADVDASDTSFAFTVTNPISTYGNMSVDGSGEWTYTLDNTQAQEIGDETITETFTIQIDDGNGGVITQDIDITIVGNDDSPYIDTPNTVVEGTVTEENTLHIEDTITYLDPENSAIDYQVDPASTSAYGTFQINATTGLWEFDLDNTAAQSLGLNEEVQEAFTINITDATGNQVQEIVTVTIQGTNDTPILEASSVIAGAVEEDVTQTASGQLVVTEIDTNDVLTYSEINPPATSYGTFSVDNTGLWSFTLDASAQTLGDTTVAESHTVEITDSNGGTITQVVTITIDGNNDAPIISGTTTADVKEGAVETATGTLSANDAENDALVWQLNSASSATGTYGSFAISALGVWTYTLLENSTLALAANETDTDTFTVEVDDGNGGVTQETVTVTVTGNYVQQGGVGSDILSATTNDEFFFGGPADLSDAGTGDTFEWTAANFGGDDVINDFDVGNDVVDVSDALSLTSDWDPVALAAQVQLTENAEGNAELTVDDNSTLQTITFDGVSEDELLGQDSIGLTDAEKLTILNDSGTLVVSDTYNPIASDVFTATGQSDILTGDSGEDIFTFVDNAETAPNTTINSFTLNEDKLDISELLADTGVDTSSVNDLLNYISVDVDDTAAATTITVTDDVGKETNITLEGIDSSALGLSGASLSDNSAVLTKLFDDFNAFKLE